MRALLGAIVAAGLVVGPSPPQRVLVAGPVVAGTRVVWGEQSGGLSVLRAWPDPAPLWESATSWFAGPLAGSATTVAFARSFDPCAGQAGVACPVETQTVAGPPHGSLRPLGRSERCTAAGGQRRLAISGSLVAFFKLDCASTVGTVIVRAGRRVVFQRQGAGCCEVALAGDVLAWRSGSGVAVADVRSGRIAYRVRTLAGLPIAGFDVQADGRLALAFGPGQDGSVALAWRDPGSNRLHILGLRIVLPASGPIVRFAGDRLVAERRTGASTELAVADLNGGVHTLARFSAPVEPVGDFDAAAGRVVWASRRITSTRVDCPPNGQGRPCLLLKSGIETVWGAGLVSGQPRPIAHWAFRDLP